MKLYTSKCCDAEVEIQARNGGCNRNLRVYCSICNKLQDTYRSPFTKWSEEDLEELDTKFDALCEYLNVEFVFQKVSDGSKYGDRHSVVVRKKKK